MSKDILRFYETDLDLDRKIKLTALKRETIFKDISFTKDEYYELFCIINRHISSKNNKNFFIFKTYFIHLTFL